MMLRATLLAVLLATQVAAHDTHPLEPPPAAMGQPLPLPLGGPFVLTDQHGNTRTEVDPEGRLQLVFFGYAACESICTVALPQMARLAQHLRDRGIAIRPVMITVDPENDTPQGMDRALAALDADFLGLTGTPEALAAVYRSFAIEHSVVFTDPAGQPVYAHGSFLYLLDGQGRLLSVLPPVLADDRLEGIIAAFAVRG